MADASLPTLEQVMNGSNPFELIETPLGKMEKWRAETLLIGSTSGIQDVYRTIRDDAATKAARADEAEARNALIEHLCTKVADFERRFDEHVARLNEAEEQRRADQERETEFEEEPLELPPDIDEHQQLSPPTKIEGDNAHDTHIPGGELHTVAAKEDPPATLLEDNVGDLPEQNHHTRFLSLKAACIRSQQRSHLTRDNHAIRTRALRRKPQVPSLLR